MIAGLQLTLEKMLMPANDYLVTGNAVEKDNFAHLSAQVEGYFDQIEALVFTPQERAELEDARGKYTRLRDKSLELRDFDGAHGPCRENGGQDTESDGHSPSSLRRGGSGRQCGHWRSRLSFHRQTG